MTSTNDTNNLQRVTPTDTSMDFDANQDKRRSGESMIEPVCLTHWVTQHMTATWGN